MGNYIAETIFFAYNVPPRGQICPDNSVVFTINSNKYQHVVTEEGKGPVTEELTMDAAAVQKNDRSDNGEL